LITEQDKLKIVPKKDTIFSFDFTSAEGRQVTIHLYGNQIRRRSILRMVKTNKSTSNDL